MANLLFEFILPVMVIVALFVAVGVYRTVQYPSPLVWGRIINKLGPARAHHVLDHNEEIENEETAGWRLRREARRQHFKVNWGYLCSQTRNTVLFLQALRFEQLKIKPTKPGLSYEPREVAIVALIDEAVELRWKQVRWQLILQLRAVLGLSIDKEIFITLLVQYKNFEEGMIALAESQESWLRGMLVERLGLMDWHVIEGGESGPELA